MTQYSGPAGGTTAVDLSRLPFPAVIEALNFEDIVAGLKSDLIALAPETSTVLQDDSEVLVKLIHMFASCIADAGLPDEISSHWMRHTCATRLMEAGVEVWDAWGFLGMFPATLIKNYGHHRPDYQDDVRNRFG